MKVVSNPAIFNPARLRIAMGRRMKTKMMVGIVLDVTPQKIQGFLRFGKIPTSKQVEQMAHFLDFPISWFYKEGGTAPIPAWW